ncbi:SPASM domain-containing protein [Bradyrhizobium sp. CB3481]|uniref:SPASM domain-containing protein n=1 Tax=Bradyrhizobium sp. CB3481 TaxID=3039158 RepID=UPI0024B21C1E|nr:SPASM domain-containing protein [Bradyrhizobium sp. CB3481]WFU14374.1 SPASM domain-containing protein [Bradyrhizobium sp. CB3481]
MVHVFDDGAYMNRRFVRQEYLDLMRQLVDADISSIQFVVLGEVHPDVADIIPAGALIRTPPLSSRVGSVDPKLVESRQPVVGPLTCVDERQYRNVLLPNGDVALCCMDFERRHVFGNLLRDEYEDLFKGPIFSHLGRSSQVARKKWADRLENPHPGCSAGCRRRRQWYVRKQLSPS